MPVDAFWSVSLYNAEGYYEKNPYGAYTVNNLTATKSADGSTAVQFIQEHVAGKLVEWMEEVSDEQYRDSPGSPR